MVADDIESQMRLLAEIMDGELEDDRDLYGSGDNEQGVGSLTQDFPFADAPPTSDETNLNKAGQSPALDYVIDSLKSTWGGITSFERQSIKKVIRNITGTFVTSFGEWTVGVGMESQLSVLRTLVGLPPYTVAFGWRYVDKASERLPTSFLNILVGDHHMV